MTAPNKPVPLSRFKELRAKAVNVGKQRLLCNINALIAGFQALARSQRL